MSNAVVFDAAGICSLVDGDPKLLDWSELMQYLWVYNDVRPGTALISNLITKGLDKNVLEKPLRSICLAAVEPDKLDLDAAMSTALTTSPAAWFLFKKVVIMGQDRVCQEVYLWLAG